MTKPSPTLATVTVLHVAAEHVSCRVQDYHHDIDPERSHITVVRLGSDVAFTVAGLTATEQAHELRAIAAKLASFAADTLQAEEVTA